MKRAVVAGISTLTLLFPVVLGATHGGMEYAEPLGWDAADHKAFFLVHCVSESDRGPFVIYFDIDGPSPQRPVQAGWSKGGSHDQDPKFASRLQALRRRLRPLVDVPGQTVFHYTWSIKEDSVASLGGDSRFKRYRVHVSDQNITNEGFEVTTLCEPVVRMIRRYRVGKTGPTFGIFSFRGVPVEMCYETQVPVLLSSSHDPTKPPTKIEWIRWE